MSRCSATHLGSLAAIALALLTPHYAQALQIPGADAQPPAVVLLLGRNLLDRRLPAFMQVQPGRFVAARTLQRACTTPGLKPESLLLFLPDSQHCELIKPQDEVMLRQRLHELTGRWPANDPVARVAMYPFWRSRQFIIRVAWPGRVVPAPGTIRPPEL